MSQAADSLKLVLRGGTTPINNPEEMLRRYTDPIDMFYLEYKGVTDQDKLFPEDVAITLAFNSRASKKTVYSLRDCSFDLSAIPDTQLEETTPQERSILANLVVEMANLPGIQASIATKILHKKRPKLIPVLDNKAIFGAYMNLNPPDAKKNFNGAKKTIEQTLQCIHNDLIANKNVWPELKKRAHGRTSIQIFDMIWWQYFIEKQTGEKK